MSADPAPRREVVTGVPRRERSSARYVPPQSEIDEQTALGATYVRSLMRSQLRAGVMAFTALALLIGTLPVVFSALSDDPGGPAIVWVVLGVAVYPVLLLIARWYVRRAERNEKDFARLVESR